MNTPTPETDGKCFPEGIRDEVVHADFARKLERERDMWKANHDNQVELKRMLMDRPDLNKNRARLISDVIAERDQLRKVADALFVANTTPELEQAFDSYNQLPHVKSK